MPRTAGASTLVVVLLALACCRNGDPPGQALPAAELDVAGPAGEVGFDLPVRLRAQVRPPGAGRWRLGWRQVWGPPARELRELDGGETLELRTPPPPSAEDARRYRGQPLPLSAQAAGRMVFEVSAERDEDRARMVRALEVIPAFPSPGWPRLAVGAWLYLSTDAPRDWKVERGPLRLEPVASAGHLLRARGLGAEWFRVRRPDGASLELRGGVWLGDQGCGRFDCHPRERAGWARTAHAGVLARGLSGELDGSAGGYNERCLPCHTVGYQPGADNDGFDDRARALGWRVPGRLSARLARELPTALRERAGVQCESCHGPGWFYLGYGEAICAQCHDLPPRYPVVAQLRQNRMLGSGRAVADERADTACRDCHQADEVLRSLRGHRSSSRPDLELERVPRGITCPVCHDPHQRDCRRQLRLCGEVEIPGGLVQAGQGALCISCHTGEANVRRGPLLRPFQPGTPRAAGGGHGQAASAAEREPEAAPHAPQFQLLSGRGGQFLRLPSERSQRPVYPHLAVPESCVGCHYREAQRREPERGHTFKLLEEPSASPATKDFCARRLDLSALRRSRVTGSCAPCHGALARLDAPARGDYDGDGKVLGLVTEVAGLLGLLRQELERQIRARGVRDAGGATAESFGIAAERVVLVSAACEPLRAPRGGPRSLLPEAPLLHKAAFNFLLVVRDGSGGLHNPQYAVKLLQSTILELERARGREARHSWKEP